MNSSNIKIFFSLIFEYEKENKVILNNGQK